jgi:hypothetical protein
MQVAVEFTGRTGLVFHNIRLADPRDSYTRQIAELTSKGQNRTEADEVEIERLEWYGGLYHAPDIGVYVPASNIVRCLRNAGAVTRLGKKVQGGISMLTDRVPLEHGGPRDLAEMYADPQYTLRVAVGINRAKIMRVRPIFRTWRLGFEVELGEDVLDLAELEAVAERAGRSEGLGDGRTLGYGRFTATVTGNLQPGRNGSVRRVSAKTR